MVQFAVDGSRRRHPGGQRRDEHAPPQDFTLDEFRAAGEPHGHVPLRARGVPCDGAPAAQDRHHRLHGVGARRAVRGAVRAAKGGVQLTKSLASAWAADIQVNAACHLSTPSDQGGAPASVGAAGARRRARRRDAGAGRRLAGVAVFLASPASDFITGAAIPVDGGYSRGSEALTRERGGRSTRAPPRDEARGGEQRAEAKRPALPSGRRGATARAAVSPPVGVSPPAPPVATAPPAPVPVRRAPVPVVAPPARRACRPRHRGRPRLRRPRR